MSGESRADLTRIARQAARAAAAPPAVSPGRGGRKPASGDASRARSAQRVRASTTPLLTSQIRADLEEVREQLRGTGPDVYPALDRRLREVLDLLNDGDGRGAGLHAANGVTSALAKVAKFDTDMAHQVGAAAAARLLALAVEIARIVSPAQIPGGSRD